MNTRKKTFSVMFYLIISKVRNGKAPIYARITVDGQRVDISIKREIEVSSWNVQRGAIKGTKEESKALQFYLEQYRALIVDAYQQMTIERKPITAETLKNRFLGKSEDADVTLKALVEYHNKEMVAVLSAGTLKNYYTTQRYLEKFVKAKYNLKDISLRELSYKFIHDFEFYLRTYQPVGHQKPLANNGVMKHLERLRKMVTLACKLGWVDKDPFLQYKLKFTKVDMQYLNEDELFKLETKELPLKRLDSVRDLFIFSCYTGLAYIDVMDLDAGNVVTGHDNNYWLNTSRHKTDIAVKVPLLPKALELIDKYKAHPKAQYEAKLFPSISNQRLNSYLKELAVICDVNKELTFHCARHTFATTVTLSNGVPIESVSKMLGHTKISTTQIYARVIEKKLGEDMQALNIKLKLNIKMKKE